MKKQIIPALLALCMVLTLLPITALATETEPGQDDELIETIEDLDGDGVDDDDDTGLTQLATPTNLTWSFFGGKNVPGVTSWEASNSQSRFEITYYLKDQPEPVFSHTLSMGFQEWGFIVLSSNFESGTYYFTVQSLGDGIDYADSEIATSDEYFEYTKPSSALTPPTLTGWDGITATWDIPADSSNIFGYEVLFYYSETEDGELRNVGATSSSTPMDGNSALYDSILSEFGTGYYYYCVRTLSSNINAVQNSPWSDWSEAYHLSSDEVAGSLQDILSGLDESADASDIQSAVQNLGTDTLKTAMLADNGDEGGVLDLLSQLEAKTGITVDAASTINEFDDSKVTIVGAALNDVEENTTRITLNIGEPENQNDVIPELYNQTLAVRFSMDLEGVANTNALAVPVRITLPIPATINPNYLVILHYGSDGSTDVMNAGELYKYKEENQWYVSFVVDHFSDFVMTEMVQQEVSPSPTPTPTPTPTTYTVSVADTTGGKVTVSRTSASYGAAVTVTATPNTGYTLDELTVKDSSGRTITLTGAGSGKYTFTMPASRVTVTASFVRQSTSTSSTSFTGGGSSSSSSSSIPVSNFTDLDTSAYYYDAVRWALARGIATGTSTTAFSPNATCSRAQMVTFLWRAAGSPQANAAVNPFTDISSDAYYYDAVLWAVSQGITTGTSATTFGPEAECSRGQAVAFLFRASGNYAASGSNPFADVADGEYYTSAVTWAVSHNVTTGTSATTFSPDSPCTRAEIVTFLYRDRV